MSTNAAATNFSIDTYGNWPSRNNHRFKRANWNFTRRGAEIQGKFYFPRVEFGWVISRIVLNTSICLGVWVRGFGTDILTRCFEYCEWFNYSRLYILRYVSLIINFVTIIRFFHVSDPLQPTYFMVIERHFFSNNCQHRQVRV